ncbi:MAG: DUF302 domain-containing protein [Lewinella sp.]
MILRSLLLFPLLFTFLGCQDDDDFVEILNRNEPDDVPGLNWVEAEDGGLNEIYDSLVTSLTANPNISIVAEVDHARNASTTGASLRATRVVMFGNPALGTPLMQVNPQAGLDLPQKMLVYLEDDDDVIVAYNTPEYLANRHGLGSAATLGQIGTALRNLATSAGGDGVETGESANEIELNEGVTSYSAAGSVDSVYMNLRSAIAGNSALTIVAELDHQANAASVNMELPPIRLIVFGNPNLGTPLLLEEQSIGIDLPQKMLVYESAAGEVTIAYNDPFFLADRHDVDGDLPQLSTISDALEGLARGALGL